MDRISFEQSLFNTCRSGNYQHVHTVPCTVLEIGNLSEIAPRVLVAGCAGCGVGLLSLIGVASLVTLLPFQGLSLKIGGIILITFFIARTGNPEICSIPSS